MLDKIKYINFILKRNGYKLTSQRKNIFRSIINFNGHITIEEIYDNVKDKGIGLATIYRTLDLFEELNIIKKVEINNNKYYEMKIFSGDPMHIHFKCNNCDKIIDIKYDTINIEMIKMLQKLEKNKKFKIFDSDIVFKGICSNCRRESNAKT